MEGEQEKTLYLRILAPDEMRRVLDLLNEEEQEFEAVVKVAKGGKRIIEMTIDYSKIWHFHNLIDRAIV